MNNAHTFLLLAVLTGCGSTQNIDCICEEWTEAKFQAPVESATALTVTVTWSEGSVTCDVEGTSAECDSSGALTSEEEEGVIWFVTDVTDLEGDGQHVEVHPQIESVHVPGKVTDISVELLGSTFATSGALRAENGSSSNCSLCDYWSVDLVADDENTSQR